MDLIPAKFDCSAKSLDNPTGVYRTFHRIATELRWKVTHTAGCIYITTS
jgi:hypothetical protein